MLVGVYLIENETAETYETPETNETTETFRSQPYRLSR